MAAPSTGRVLGSDSWSDQCPAYRSSVKALRMAAAGFSAGRVRLKQVLKDGDANTAALVQPFEVWRDRVWKRDDEEEDGQVELELRLVHNVTYHLRVQAIGEKLNSI